jgi:hypothetical protein
MFGAIWAALTQPEQHAQRCTCKAAVAASNALITALGVTGGSEGPPLSTTWASVLEQGCSSWRASRRVRARDADADG